VAAPPPESALAGPLEIGAGRAVSDPGHRQRGVLACRDQLEVELEVQAHQAARVHAGQAGGRPERALSEPSAEDERGVGPGLEPQPELDQRGPERVEDRRLLGAGPQLQAEAGVAGRLQPSRPAGALRCRPRRQDAGRHPEPEPGRGLSPLEDPVLGHEALGHRGQPVGDLQAAVAAELALHRLELRADRDAVHLLHRAPQGSLQGSALGIRRLEAGLAPGLDRLPEARAGRVGDGQGGHDQSGGAHSGSA
jgi:hypothetical protein